MFFLTRCRISMCQGLGPKNTMKFRKSTVEPVAGVSKPVIRYPLQHTYVWRRSRLIDLWFLGIPVMTGSDTSANSPLNSGRLGGSWRQAGADGRRSHAAWDGRVRYGIGFRVIYIYIYIYIMCIHIHTHIIHTLYMHVCMYVCMYACMYACMHACMYVGMYVCKLMYVS